MHEKELCHAEGAKAGADSNYDGTNHGQDACLSISSSLSPALGQFVSEITESKLQLTSYYVCSSKPQGFPRVLITAKLAELYAGREARHLSANQGWVRRLPRF